MKELSVKEATEILKVSETTIRRMIKRGDLPNAHKQDQKLWIPQGDIDAYLQRQQEASAQEAKAKPKSKTKAKAKPKPKPEPLTEAEVKIEPKPSEPEVAPEPEKVPEPTPQEPEPAAPILEAEPAPVETPSVEESEPTPPPSIEAETPVIEPEWVETLQHQKEIIKEHLVTAGIKSLGWLEQSFKTIRAKVEQYKAELLEKDDSEKKEDE
jgi:excisionase family DNA binding protein